MLGCTKYTKISNNSLEFKLCGEIGCDLCPRMTCVLQMHDEDLTKGVLIVFPLPQLYVDGKTFVPINECQNLMDNGSSLSDELKDLENLRGKFKYNSDDLEEREKRDGNLGKQINWSKVRKVQKCDECMSPR